MARAWRAVLLAALVLVVCAPADARADPAAARARAEALRDQAAAECATRRDMPERVSPREMPTGTAQRDVSERAGLRDVLARVVCDGVLRVGLRTDYHGFSARDVAGAQAGFEVDLARAIAMFLRVRLEPVVVDPKTRIPILTGQGADLVIATMGHTVQRDPNAGFVRPHYFASRTAVVGSAGSTVTDWDDLRAGQSVCLPLGASFNILFVQRHIRILTFDSAGALMDALNFGQCAFIAHDDTFFTRYLSDPAWRSRFAIRFGFAPIPWGMAVPPDNGGRLLDLLSALSASWHAEGRLLALAEPHGVPLGFLTEQRERFSNPTCFQPDGSPASHCLLPPVDTAAADRPSAFAPIATALEAMLAEWLGLSVDLGAVKTQAGASLVLEGIGYSLAMVVGSMLTTLGFAYLLAALVSHWIPPLRWVGALLIQIGQSTPMPLLLFFGYVVAGGLTAYSPVVALLTAMIMLGFYNGGYTASAIQDARAVLGPGAGFRTTTSLAWTQIVAFLINATKGAPAADMIGVPEFLGVITDLTTHARDRFVLYAILLVFYTALVLLAIAGMSWIERRVIRRWGHAR